MKKQRFTIQNKVGENIVGLFYDVDNSKGTAIIQHGLGSTKEYKHIAAMAEGCVNAGWQAICFDSRHSFGESDGDLFYSTVSSYRADLETVIEQMVPSDHRLLLAGHSMGAASILSYTCDYPEKVVALAPLAAVISHDFFVEAGLKKDKDSFLNWQKDGRYLKVSKTVPGKQAYVSWNFIEDMKNLRILEYAGSLMQPIFMAVGEHDATTPAYQQQHLYELWNGPKELHVISNGQHTFQGDALKDLQGKFKIWLSDID